MLSGSAVAERLAEKPTVVDGDTVKIDGKRKRLRNHDAPETSASRGRHAPKCEAERIKGEASKARFKEIIDNAKTIDIKTVARDKYHRDVIEMKVDGKDPGKQLIAEGLAKRHKVDWCR
jgi:endonuclease YncB( thermonuclease family)